MIICKINRNLKSQNDEMHYIVVLIILLTQILIRKTQLQWNWTSFCTAVLKCSSNIDSWKPFLNSKFNQWNKFIHSTQENETFCLEFELGDKIQFSNTTIKWQPKVALEQVIRIINMWYSESQKNSEKQMEELLKAFKGNIWTHYLLCYIVAFRQHAVWSRFILNSV